MIFTPSPKFSAPVVLQQFDEQGVLQEVKFNALFKRLKQSETDALATANVERSKQRQAEVARGIDIGPQVKQDFVDLLTNNMVGWSNVQDENKNNVPFSYPVLFDLCEQNAGLLLVLAQTFYQACFDPVQAAQLATKN